MKKWGWIYLAELIAYGAVIFLLYRWQITEAFMVSILPFAVNNLIGSSAFRAMAGYMSYDYPKSWRWGIFGELHYFRWIRGGFHLINKGIGDPEYEELKKRFKRAFLAYLFSACAFYATGIYAAVTLARH